LSVWRVSVLRVPRYNKYGIATFATQATDPNSLDKLPNLSRVKDEDKDKEYIFWGVTGREDNKGAMKELISFLQPTSIFFPYPKPEYEALVNKKLEIRKQHERTVANEAKLKVSNPLDKWEVEMSKLDPMWKQKKLSLFKKRRAIGDKLLNIAVPEDYPIAFDLAQDLGVKNICFSDPLLMGEKDWAADNLTTFGGLKTFLCALWDSELRDSRLKVRESREYEIKAKKKFSQHALTELTKKDFEDLAAKFLLPETRVRALLKTEFLSAQLKQCEGPTVLALVDPWIVRAIPEIWGREKEEKENVIYPYDAIEAGRSQIVLEYKIPTDEVRPEPLSAPRRRLESWIFRKNKALEGDEDKEQKLKRLTEMADFAEKKRAAMQEWIQLAGNGDGETAEKHTRYGVKWRNIPIQWEFQQQDELVQDFAPYMDIPGFDVAVNEVMLSMTAGETMFDVPDASILPKALNELLEEWKAEDVKEAERRYKEM